MCRSKGEWLLAGLTPPVFEEALATGNLGTLLVVTDRLYITIKFKPKTPGEKSEVVVQK